MERVLYLPVHLGLSRSELIRLAEVVTEIELSARERVESRSLQESQRSPEQVGFDAAWNTRGAGDSTVGKSPVL